MKTTLLPKKKKEKRRAWFENEKKSRRFYPPKETMEKRGGKEGTEKSTVTIAVFSSVVGVICERGVHIEKGNLGSGR